MISQAAVAGTDAAPRVDEAVSLCMVNFNGVRYLEASLSAALREEHDFREVLLVDNASDDGSLELLRSKFPSVRVIPLETNGGPAIARNRAYVEASSDLILFLDNDVAVDVDCPRLLRRALEEHPTAAIAMPSVRYAHSPDVIQYDGADNHYLGMMRLQHAGEQATEPPGEVRRIDSVVTACFLLDRRKWGPAPPFDESFFIYQEDHDFGVRARLLGHEILSVPAARCFHDEGTVGLAIRQTGKYTALRVLCLIRNRWQFLAKNYSARSLALLAPMFLVFEAAQLAVSVKKGWLGSWLRAVFWMLRNAPEVLRKRAQIQRTRQIADREILRGGPIPFVEEVATGRVERWARNLLNRLTMSYWSIVKRVV